MGPSQYVPGEMKENYKLASTRAENQTSELQNTKQEG